MWLIIVFIIQQVIDGIFTWHGVTQEGTCYEMNKLLVFFFGKIGIVNTLIIAKVVATACGIFLYKEGCRKLLIGLNVIYFILATFPHLYVFFFVK